MSLTIDINNSEKILMPSFDEQQAKNIKQKGWSFSYVYNFSEIKDVYLALRQCKFNNLNSFTAYCISINLPYVRTLWNKRRILEHLNALKNFELIDENYNITKEVFLEDTIGKELSTNSFTTFHEIYFKYFRFKEIFSWFINPLADKRDEFIFNLTEDEIVKSSRALFCFSNKSRFTDSFFFEFSNNPPVFFIDLKSSEDLMRFWDVFVKWGTVLGVLEKFNLKNLDAKTINNKGIACTYVLQELDPKFDLLEFIETKYGESYIYIPNLVFDIATTFRIKIEDIHKLIIEKYKSHKEYISFERTSEIFIKKQDIKQGDKIFFPKYNDSYISHLIIRK